MRLGGIHQSQHGQSMIMTIVSAILTVVAAQPENGNSTTIDDMYEFNKTCDFG